MVRPKRSKEEEILHLEKKIRKLKSVPLETNISGEYQSTEPCTSRRESTSKRELGEILLSPEHISTPLSPRESHTRSTPVTNLDLTDANTSKSELQVNMNAHSSRSKPRENLSGVDARSTRSEPQGNSNDGNARSSGGESRGNLSGVDPCNTRSEPQTNLNDSNARSSRGEPQALNDKNAHSSRGEPTLDADEALFRPQKNLGAIHSRENPSKTRVRLDTSETENSSNESDTHPTSETYQANKALGRRDALLQALGDDLFSSGEHIHESMVQTWTTILRKGLKISMKDKLLKEYAVPENCNFLKAPILNEEVSGVALFQSKKRDKILEDHQNQLGLGITAIGRAITVLINRGDDVNAMKHLNHGCRILLDLHHTETNSRRNLFNKELTRNEVFRNLAFWDLERDETLFGNKLAKLVKKQGIPIPPANTRNLSFSYGEPSSSNRARNYNDAQMSKDGEPMPSRFQRR